MTTVVPPSSSSPSTATSPATAATAKKPSNPGHPWSHIETTSLIDAYESKWYSLNRGQLKAQQWEEVASAVAARCSSAALLHPPKSGTQCRHKIEKLRKRFRAEKNRPIPSLWPYFDRMERLERGPVPIAVKDPTLDSESSEDDDEGEENREYGNCGLLMEVALEVRRMGEGMMRVEKRRMELMREIERGWMDTEARRAEMVVDAQRGILESIAEAFEVVKKARTGEDL